MKRFLSHPRTLAFAFAILILSLSTFGLAAGASQAPALQPNLESNPPAAPYPADVQVVMDGGSRQIVKTYTFTDGQDPSGIPRGSFERDGWRYELADITEASDTEKEARMQTVTVEVSTDSNDLNAVAPLLEPSIPYEDEDGFAGTLSLDVSTVACEPAGWRSGSYAVTAKREFLGLSGPDTSLIPKQITENGVTLALDDIMWAAEDSTTVDFVEIPNSYRALASYSARVPTSVVTGYTTTADYTGEVSRVSGGATVYTAHFLGTEIPAPATPPQEAPVAPTPEAPDAGPTESADPWRTTAIILAATFSAICMAALSYTFWHALRRNAHIYAVADGRRNAVAKRRISSGRPIIDLTDLGGPAFYVEIDRPTARRLSGRAVEFIHGNLSLFVNISDASGAFCADVDFATLAVRAS